MKKYKCSLLLLIIIISTTQLSCKKYLDEKSDDTLIVPSRLADFQNLMDDATTMNYNTPGFGASSADDYFIDDAAYNAKSIFLQHVYKWMPHPYNYQNDWGLSYKAIYVSNLCLERIPLVAREASNASEWDHIKGSALFYKAFYHLELAWLFAKSYDVASAHVDAGIVLRPGTDFLETSVRATVAETYQKILEDAMAAAQLLPDNPSIATRPSRCAAYALLARTYLSMRQYDSAGKYANRSLQIKNSLVNYNDATQVALSSSNPFKLFNREVIFHATMNLQVSLYSPSSGPARIDSMLYASYHVNDLRRRAFFTAISGYYRFKGSYSGTTSRLFSGITVDELLLMRAECYARAGATTTALDDLNTLLEQRYAPANFVRVNTATSAEALFIILQERRKELMFRGSLRWMDIKRLNKEQRGIVMKGKVMNEIFILSPNDNRFALQIPNDVIVASGIQQN